MWDKVGKSSNKIAKVDKVKTTRKSKRQKSGQQFKNYEKLRKVPGISWKR